MLIAAAHFSFTVSDMDQSTAFYGDVLGLEKLYEMEHRHPYTSRQVNYENAHLVAVGFDLGYGEFPVLELIEYRNPQGTTIDLATKNTGVAHLAFLVEDIHAEYERLTAAGVEFRSEPVLIEAGRSTGGYTVYFLDPDGITLELAQRPKAG